MSTMELLDAKCIASSLRTVHASARGLRTPAFCDYLKQLDLWLKSYNEWYVEAAGISGGRNLQLVYGHSFLLSDASEESDARTLEAFLASVTAHGLSAGVVLSSITFAALGEGLLRCIRAGTLRDLRIGHSGPADSKLEGTMQSLIRTCQQEGIVPMMLGDYEFWSRVILQGKILDRTAFTIVPRSVNPTVRRNCHGRIGCYIEPDGHIYPCLNMRGNMAARIGNIYSLPAFAGGLPSFIAEAPQWASVNPVRERVYSPGERASGTMCHEHNLSVSVG